MLNREAVEKAIRFGLAINAKVANRSVFDRKHYFYPDLPKAYQISQFEHPVVIGGELTIQVENPDGTTYAKTVHLTRAHLEEDAGKSVHGIVHGKTGIDLNRAGTPLLEIVSEPEMRSSAEAVAYARALHELVTWIGVSDGDMQKGNFRCDANVSVRPKGQKEFGTRCEIKNLNSFKFLQAAIDYEVRRQIELISEGGKVVQATRLYDPDNDETREMRTKEDSMDYRYFPDPDLVAVEISDEWLEQIRSEIPELPQSRYNRYMEEIGLQPKEARILADSFDKACLLDEGVNMQRVDAKNIANWILSDISKYLNDKNLELKDTKLTAQKLVDMIELIEKNTISGNAGKKVLVQLFETDDSVDTIVDKLGLKQVSDEGAIQKLVDEVLAANPKSVADYKKGKKNAIGFLVGQCMKASKGKGNPKMINQLLSKTLDSME